MDSFLVEFRMHGYARDHAKEVIQTVSRKYRVKGVTRKWVVPHISLYGPGKTKDIKSVVAAVKKVGGRYSLVPFQIKGFGFFDKSPKVIYFDVSPSRELEELRWELSQELRRISSCQPWDSERKHSFHATIAFKDIDDRFSQIWSYLKGRKEPNIRQPVTERRLARPRRGTRVMAQQTMLKAVGWTKMIAGYVSRLGL